MPKSGRISQILCLVKEDRYKKRMYFMILYTSFREGKTHVIVLKKVCLWWQGQGGNEN